MLRTTAAQVFGTWRGTGLRYHFEVAIPLLREPWIYVKTLKHLWSTRRQATPFCCGMQASLEPRSGAVVIWMKVNMSCTCNTVVMHCVDTPPKIDYRGWGVGTLDHICHVMSCYVMCFDVTQCNAMYICHVMLCYVMSCHVMCCDVTQCNAIYIYIPGYSLVTNFFPGQILVWFLSIFCRFVHFKIKITCQEKNLPLHVFIFESWWICPGISALFPGISAQKNRHIFAK